MPKLSVVPRHPVILIIYVMRTVMPGNSAKLEYSEIILSSLCEIVTSLIWLTYYHSKSNQTECSGSGIVAFFSVDISAI